MQGKDAKIDEGDKTEDIIDVHEEGKELIRATIATGRTMKDDNTPASLDTTDEERVQLH